MKSLLTTILCLGAFYITDRSGIEQSDFGEFRTGDDAEEAILCEFDGDVNELDQFVINERGC